MTMQMDNHNNQLVTVTSTRSVGCTFLDWSINYLSGSTVYCNADRGILPLIDNPLTKSNSHNHVSNHPRGFEETQVVVNTLRGFNGLKVIYPTGINFDVAARLANIDIFNISDNIQSVKSIYKLIEDDYNTGLNFLYNSGSKIIFLSLDDTMSLYLTNTRIDGRLFYNSEVITNTVEEGRESKDLIFFSNKEHAWGSFDNKWDLRERMALDYRPFDTNIHKMNFTIPHYWVDSREWWFNGEDVITKIMDYIKIPIDVSRYDHWLTVYRQWQKIQFKHTKFAHEYKHIVESIINGWDYNIDLNFQQEVVIQHCLIYQHGLNLKTWQLEKFPNNTKDLHVLLEDNIHPLNYQY